MNIEELIFCKNTFKICEGLLGRGRSGTASTTSPPRVHHRDGPGMEIFPNLSKVNAEVSKFPETVLTYPEKNGRRSLKNRRLMVRRSR